MRKRILCIGDSNTWGYDPRSYFGSQYPSEVRWTGLLERSGLQVINCGENGMTIPCETYFPLRERLSRSRLPADVVTVMLGTNDLLEGSEAEETTERMKRFLICVTSAAPAARALLIAPPILKRGTWVQSEKQIENSVKLAVLYRDLAAETGVSCRLRQESPDIQSGKARETGCRGCLAGSSRRCVQEQCQGFVDAYPLYY